MEDLKENGWGLRRAAIQDSSLLADLIAVSFHDVATRFGLGRDNCPSHPSLITSDRVERGFRLGTEFLLAFQGTCPCGCVGLRRPVEGVSTLEKLAVAPAFRRQGLGRILVRQALSVAQRAGAMRVEIGIIARQQELRAWYESLGFRAVRNAQFEQLPFEVLFLQKTLGGGPEA
ncbi:GNAT family N-acetyltransferase [Desulfovibrio sp. DV]|uniref:GNAT family N-acetyltransferase n=1 Tax=Desulfovibrio sp. DV TaxID=1844708 RepID=UPI00094B9BCE|nr:GNAT family N-acetyltransferase [Desulfovibrio sp. DV]